MKRVLTFLAVMLLPLSVMAMTPVSDSTLSDVTGQAGVNINADLTMNINIGTMAWGDATGVDASASAGGTVNWGAIGGAGYVGVRGFDITGLRIKAREVGTYDGYNTTMLKPITIDVATDTAGTRYAAGTTFVRFGLGSLQITLDALDFDVALAATGAGITSSTQVLGTVSFGAMGIYIDPDSFVDIYAGSGVGVNLTMDIEIDQFALGYVSWGDSDGLASNVGAGGVTWFSGAGAGYVGLDNLLIGGPILINGTIGIDVTTPTGGAYTHSGLTPVTVVHIAFERENFVVDVTGPITADVVLGNAADFNGTVNGILGDIYISAFRLTIAQNSWVDIWAH